MRRRRPISEATSEAIMSTPQAAEANHVGNGNAQACFRIRCVTAGTREEENRDTASRLRGVDAAPRRC
jgi:hypothetical protein